MKNATFIILLIICLMASVTLLHAQEQTEQKKTKTFDIDYTAGLRYSNNRTPVLLGDDQLENTLLHSYLAVEVEFRLFDFLSLGVIAGYNNNKLDGPVDFIQLPLSLQSMDQSYHSMVAGVKVEADLFSWRTLSLSANSEMLFFKKFEKNGSINLPVVTGTSQIQHSFSQFSIELLTQYDGFSTFTLFAGPRINLIKGKITASEKIENLEGKQDISYDQKNTLGFVGGVNFELGSHFDLLIKLNLFSNTSISASIYYIF